MSNRERIELEEPIWQRQTDEPPKAFERFIAYRDAKRTLQIPEFVKAFPHLLKKSNTGDKLNYSSVRIEAFIYSWKERRASFLAHIDSIRVEQREEEIRKMEIRHSASSELAQKVLTLPVRKLGERLSAAEGNQFLNDLPMDELIKIVQKNLSLLPTIQDQERKSRGEPTQIHKSNTDITSAGEAIKVILPTGD